MQSTLDDADQHVQIDIYEDADETTLKKWITKFDDDAMQTTKHMYDLWKYYNTFVATSMYCTSIVAYYYGGNQRRVAKHSDMRNWYGANLHHNNDQHMWFNFAMILILGTVVEYLHGTLMTTVLIVVSSFSSSFAVNTYTCGASGVAYCLLGAIFADFLSRVGYNENLMHMFANFILGVTLTVVLLITYFTFMEKNVCHICHLSGYLTGTMIMFAYGAYVMCSRKRMMRGCINGIASAASLIGIVIPFLL